MDDKEYRQRLTIAVAGGLAANPSQVDFISRVALLSEKNASQLMANAVTDLVNRILFNEVDPTQ
jgi:hypothetical protein